MKTYVEPTVEITEYCLTDIIAVSTTQTTNGVDNFSSGDGFGTSETGEGGNHQGVVSIPDSFLDDDEEP